MSVEDRPANTRVAMALLGIVLAALGLAWLVRFGCDDAFISYVYSRNLVHGDGLTWFGDRVEGYTNFGWVLWNAVGLALGLDPLVWSWGTSLAALAISIVLAHHVTRARTASSSAALAIAAMLAVNYTFLAFGTSGLETMAQCALLTAAWLAVERICGADTPAPRQLALLSLLAAFALWMRLDSAIYLAVLGIVVVGRLVRTRASIVAWSAVIVPALVLVGGWFVWKVSYYGELLPNTFRAKVALSGHSIGFAGTFTWWFVREYGLYTVLAACAVASLATRRFTARLPLALVVAWLAYVLYAGGDFMEFRFFVVLMPPLFALVIETLVTPHWPRVKPWLRGVLVVGCSAWFSLSHARRWTGGPNASVDSIAAMRSFYGLLPGDDWSAVGAPLRRTLYASGAVLACNGAGAIPYFADLPTIDQLGLNDAWVARYGARPPTRYERPGHQRFATAEYLAARRVNLVIGPPVLVPRGSLTHVGMTETIGRWVSQILGYRRVDVDTLTVVAAPITPERSLLMWYRFATPAIDARIRAHGWEVRPYYRRPAPGE